MVDFATYKFLHSKALSSTDIHGPTKDEISDEVMECDEPPKAPELLVFPNKIKGYNLRQKTWGKRKQERNFLAFGLRTAANRLGR